MDLIKRSIVEPGEKLKLKERASDDTFGVKKDKDVLAKSLARLNELQQLLYADKRYGIIIVLQALDAGGKDGTIRHVMTGVNPQGCQVTSFKSPSATERAHDYLWRIHRAVPERGNIGIFNRSHYEDVLVVRVHKFVPKDVWSKRYEQINNFEKYLTENGYTFLKLFLHISKDEQKRRFEQRMNDPARNWKLSMPDFEERTHWDDYTEAYEEMLRKCSTPWAPWHIIPSDKKWFRNHLVAELLVRAMDDLKLKYPAPTVDLTKVTLTD